MTESSISESHRGDSVASSIPKPSVSLESILCTEELHRRPSRMADYEKENRALVALANALANSPRTILQTLADTILEVCESDSAGISLLTTNDGGKRFYWPAIAGKWKPHIGGGTPRDFGPCGDVLDRNTPLLMRHVEWRYTYFQPVTPPVEEVLLVPFYVKGKAVGTIWAVAHDDHRKFDAEDERIMRSLGNIASSAYQILESLDALKLQESERQRVEVAMRRSESNLRDFIENASVGLHWVGPDGLILWANQAELDLLGVMREEYIGHHISEFHADRPVIDDILTRLTRGETLHEYEARLRRKDGSIRHVVISSNALFEDDKFIHTRCFTRDITERKQAEVATASLAAIVESSDDAIISKDLNGVITTWNKGAKRLFGYTAEETIGQPVTMLMPPERFDEEPSILQRLRRGEPIEHYETVRRRKDGKLLNISLTVSPVRDGQGRVIGASKIARDITERKQNEQALQERERRFREMIDALPAAVYTTDAQGRLTHFNPAAAELSGRTPELGTDLWCVSWKMFKPDGTPLPHDECPMAIALKEGRIVRGEEAILERPDGTHRWFEPYPTPLRDAEGRITGGINMLVDITERKQAEDALRMSEERLARELAATLQLQAASAQLIQGGSADTLYQKIVGAAVAIMQSDMASMQIVDEGQNGLRMLAFQGFDSQFGKRFELNLPDTRTSCSVARRVGHRVVVPDVETCDFIAGTTALEDHRRAGIRAVQSTPLFSRDGRLLGMISTHWRTPHTPTEGDLRLFDILARQAADVLERKQAEEALQRAHDELESLVQRRTASLRRLSSHLQHVQDDERRKLSRDLHDSAGQYLAAIKMNLAQLEQSGLTDAKAAILAESNQLVDRCLAEIRTVSYLLHPPMLDEGGLASAVMWYVEGFAKRSSIQTDVDLPPTLERLPRDVEMVLFRALQESLTNVHRHSQSSKVDIRVELKDGKATLAVRDYGCGVASERLEAISGGSDSGVGLAGMRERVNELGGSFEVFSEKPGTSIRVTLPIAKADARAAQAMKRSEKIGSAA